MSFPFFKSRLFWILDRMCSINAGVEELDTMEDASFLSTFLILKALDQCNRPLSCYFLFNLLLIYYYLLLFLLTNVSQKNEKYLLLFLSYFKPFIYFWFNSIYLIRKLHFLDFKKKLCLMIFSYLKKKLFISSINFIFFNSKI